MERIWHKAYEEGVPGEIELPSTTLFEELAATAQKYGDHTATIFMGAKLTWGEIERLTAGLAAALADLGIQKGDRVAIHLPNCPQFVVSFYALSRLGAIAVPTNPLYVERELEHQFNNSEAKVVITLSRFYNLVKKVQPKTGVQKVVVARIKDYFPSGLKFLYTIAREAKEGDRVQIQPGDFWFTDLLQKYAGAKAPAAEVSPDDVACLMYTGGTTGVSKGATLTHRNLVSDVHLVKTWTTDLQPGREVIMAALPFFHSYGMTTCLNYAMTSGSAMVLEPRFETKEVLEHIQKYGVTIFPGVPTMYVAIVNYPELKNYRLNSIRSCISGAAPLPVEICNKFEELTGGKLVEGFGLSESSPVTHCNPVYGKRKVGSIGVPFPNTDAKVVDPDTGEELPVGEVGELAVKGPQVMQGYWNMPAETANTLKDGWLYTGDLARMDEEGYFYIVDRKKDMIIAGGYNIYPREVEEVLFAHPEIVEAAVAGVPDEYRGETVKAYVVKKPDSNLTAEDVIKYCRENLAPYKAPKMVEFRAELPKSMVGKVLRRVLVEEEKAKLKQK